MTPAKTTDLLVQMSVHRYTSAFISIFLFLIMLMQPYFLVHFMEENIQCVCSSENFKAYKVAYNNMAKKMLINASVLLSRGDEFASCEFLSKIFCTNIQKNCSTHVS